MKKIFSVLLSVVLICSITVASISTYFADTVYIVNGYSYSIINNNSIALCGVDSNTSDLIVPDSLAGRYFTAIADNGFEYNEGLKSVDFSQAEHLEYIGIDAFIGCSGISSEIVIPENVNSMGERAFQECYSLPSVVINANIDTVPKQCFYQCTSLETVVLPDTLSTINGFAFADCSALSYVEIPESVTGIALSAFKNDSDIVLGVKCDSYAHQYAIDNNIPYILLDGPKLGDVNGDGNVDILDSTEIQKFAAEMIELTDEQFELADINDDGFVDVIDALLVQKYVVGKYDIPPIIYNS